MADRLTIYNGALRLLGPHQLSSLTESGEARRALDSAWRPAVDFLLSEGLWNFALRTQEISQDDDVEPLFGFAYAFAKPSDWVRTQAISDEATFNSGFKSFSDEQDYWYASVDPLYVRFVSDDDEYGWNVSAWRMPFSKCLEAYLAFECGLPISGDRGTRDSIYSLYTTRLKRAKTLDAVDENVKSKPEGRLVRARLAGRARLNGTGRGL